MSKPKVLAAGVEYCEDTDDLLLIKCPKCGCENWAPQVATGTCAWCGYDAHELLNQKE
jgi:ribosomal protein L37E